MTGGRLLDKPVAVDLFSGGGGLTLGLKLAGFDVAVAVEIDPTMTATYKANHPSVHVLEKDVRNVTGSEILEHCPGRKAGLLAGCPPCQGFSTLTSKYRRWDPRNDLVSEMARIIREVQPTVVMMENVPGLTVKGSKVLGVFVDELTRLGYTVSTQVLQVADYGVPQLRRRFVLLAGKGFAIEIPLATHSRTGGAGLRKWSSLRQAIGHLGEPVTLSRAKMQGGPCKANWHVVRDLGKRNVERLEALSEGGSRRDLPDDLRPICHRDKDSGFINVYGRLAWDEPSGTITTGCTSPSKGRFGHPSMARTISVREAAVLQTFPEDYVIKTDHIETACRIVGNALPVRFAAVLAKQCAVAISSHSQVMDR